MAASYYDEKNIFSNKVSANELVSIFYDKSKTESEYINSAREVAKEALIDYILENSVHGYA